ncbi:MAG: nickel pincer cofactor biosynthesis protein LarB [Planctomycetes bacterium]|nr:nickel pincer cofactor biosynthesis protein LarB [Planctomycetota bacterium]
MDESSLRQLLAAVAGGQVDVDAAVSRLRHMPFEDLGFATLDHHRSIRCGWPEVIFCASKTVDQVRTIFSRLAARGHNVLATRASAEQYAAVAEEFPAAAWDHQSRTIHLLQGEQPAPVGHVAIVAAGTSDLPVAEEARVTAAIMGAAVTTHYDVGVAGIHRLLARAQALQDARAVVAVAGMEGALASVVGGLVTAPVIAVPTSVGYGASFGGLSALLTMLNSCATGVSVVNIDNGFAAGHIAAVINRQSVAADKGKG